MGPVARIGAAMVIGRFFTAKNASNQLDTTITDLININPCSRLVVSGIYKFIDLNNSGKKAEPIVIGRKISALVSVDKKSTGITAFL
jgi:hypothetical protein